MSDRMGRARLPKAHRSYGDGCVAQLATRQFQGDIASGSGDTSCAHIYDQLSLAIGERKST